jgi:2-desacetyl-2-hydroxyethyl bacteriochlorophyllide A dehydrogenase
VGIKAKAVVFPRAKEVEVRQIEIPEPGAEDILVKVTVSGISAGTEKWTYLGLRPDTEFPVIPGYQKAGTIEAMGNKVKGLKCGQRVFLSSTRLPAEYFQSWGGHTSYAVSDYRHAIKIPDGVPDEEASLSAVAACSFEGLSFCRIKKGDLVVVIGQGIIGQVSMQLARSRGAKVLVSDPAQARLNLAKKVGASIVVNPNSENLKERVLKAKKDGADIVVEATGITSLLDQCIGLPRYRGVLVLQGWYPGNVSINFQEAHLKEITAHFPCGWKRDRQVKILRLLSERRLKLKPLITHRIRGEDAKEAYRLIAECPEDVMGIVLKWN